MSASKKRKLEDECCIFNIGWTKQYFFSNVKDTAVCLICHATVAMFKEYNLKRHFQTNHANFGKSLSNHELKTKASDLVKSFNQQQTLIKKSSSLQKNIPQQVFYWHIKLPKKTSRLHMQNSLKAAWWKLWVFYVLKLNPKSKPFHCQEELLFDALAQLHTIFKNNC